MALFSTLFSLIMLIAIVGAIVTEYYSYRLKVVPMPTLPAVRKQITDIVTGLSLPATPCIYELGSGWGGLAYHTAQALPQAHVYGFELSPFPLFTAKWLRRRGNLRYQRKDIMTLDYSAVDVVIVYLMPHLLDRLQPLLTAQLQSGAIVIASGFPLPDQTPEMTVPMKKGLEKNIYVYRQP